MTQAEKYEKYNRERLERINNPPSVGESCKIVSEEVLRDYGYVSEIVK